jgi:hypothetical protein
VPLASKLSNGPVSFRCVLSFPFCLLLLVACCVAVWPAESSQATRLWRWVASGEKQWRAHRPRLPVGQTQLLPTSPVAPCCLLPGCPSLGCALCFCLLPRLLRQAATGWDRRANGRKPSGHRQRKRRRRTWKRGNDSKELRERHGLRASPHEKPQGVKNNKNDERLMLKEKRKAVLRMGARMPKKRQPDESEPHDA